MKKILIAVLFFSVGQLFAQFDISAGMGIKLINNSSLRDYINNSGFAAGNQVNTFTTSVEFMGEGAYSVSDKIDVGFEYAYSIYSFNSPASFGNYDLSYGLHLPSLMVFYVLRGAGYKFRFGGGAGIRFVNLTEKNIIEENYSSAGFGGLLRAEGHTSLGGNFYAVILGSARFDFPGEPSDGNKYLVDNSFNSKVNLNQISFGLTLGVSYMF